MSSDYIPRLRRELLRAGATEPSRWAPAARGLRPLAAAAAVALVALAVVLAVPWGDDEQPSRPAETPPSTLQLTYRGEPSSAADSARVMRERLAAAGVRDASVSVAAGGSLTITVPAAARADVAALVRSGRVAIYDWERSVLGPRGTPAPGDADVTGDPDAGRSAATTKSVAEARAARAADGHAVRALSAVPDGWFALGGRPALTNADIQARARGRRPGDTRSRSSRCDLTADGQKAFATLTRERRAPRRRERGSRQRRSSRPSTSRSWSTIGSSSVPFIDFRQAPDGIDGVEAMHVAGETDAGVGAAARRAAERGAARRRPRARGLVLRADRERLHGRRARVAGRVAVRDAPAGERLAVERVPPPCGPGAKPSREHRWMGPR